MSQQLKAPVVRVDPERRCAVMLIYGSHLVILPFRQEGLLDDHDPDSVFTSRSVGTVMREGGREGGRKDCWMIMIQIQCSLAGLLEQ